MACLLEVIRDADGNAIGVKVVQGCNWVELMRNTKNGFLNKGMSDEEATAAAEKFLAENMDEEALAGGAYHSLYASVVKYNTNDKIRKLAAEKIADEPIGLTLNDQDLRSNPYVQNAFLYGEKKVEIGKLDGTFNAKQTNDGEYLANRITANDPTAKNYVKRISNEGTIEAKANIIETLARSSDLNTVTKLTPVVGMKAIEDYENYVTNPLNIDWTKYTESDIKTDGKNNIKLEMTHPILGYKDVVLVSGGKLLNPDGKTYREFTVDEKNKPSDIWGVIEIPGDYGKNRTYTIRALKLMQEVFSIQDNTERTKAYDSFIHEVLEGKLDDWYNCDGLGCIQQPSGSMGGGGGGGGGGSSSGKPSTSTTKPSIYIESNEDAMVYEGNNIIGRTNSLINVETGTHTIEARKMGYKRVSRVVSVGSYPVNVTMNLYRLMTGPATFINSIGGVHELNKTHALYLFAIYKARVTGALDWRTLAIEQLIETPAPERLELNDVKYIWYLANGEPGKAGQLVTDGKVSLLDGEE